MSAMLDYIQSHDTLFWWLGAGSVVMFVGSLALVPFLVVKIPEDYFVERKRHIMKWDHLPTPARWTILILKNLVGVILLLAGIAMMVLPGQGLITILIAIVLLDFPGKFRLERWIVSKKPIHRAINWMRRKAHHPPLRLPEK